MLVIIDYGMGNLRSVAKAFEALQVKSQISNQPDEIEAATRLVLPGVGAFGEGMANLRKLNLIELLTDKVKQGTPFLGICLGMQMLAQSSTEGGLHQGLGWIEGQVDLLTSPSGKLKLPHVGWNEVEAAESRLYRGLSTRPSFYFVHSYQLITQAALLVSRAEYGSSFVASLEQENLWGTQFHPEKSQKSGMQVLRNFLAL